MTDPSGPRAVLVLGTGGSGLSTVLKQVCQEFTEDRTYLVALRPQRPHAVLDNLVKGFRTPRPTERPERQHALLAIDDAQWIGPETLERLASLLRASVDPGIRSVCTVRVDVPAASAHRSLVSALARDGLVEVVRLRPLDRTGLTELIAERAGAEPTAELVRHVSRLTRNRPKAVCLALEALTAADALRVIDLRAHLVSSPAVPTLHPQHWFLKGLRGLGPTPWSVAKAASVLEPLGDIVPQLVAEATGLSRSEVDNSLDVLRTHGIVRYVRVAGRWSFRLPLLRQILIGQAGPYERRCLARVAVTAVWEGRARCPDPDYLADQQVCAGRLLDARRAKAELLAHARASIGLGRARACSWLRAAAEFSSDEAEREDLLVEWAQLRAAEGSTADSLKVTETLLNELAVRPGAPALLIDVHLARVAMLHAVGDLTALERLAGGESWPWPADPAVQPIARAGASYALGRWQEVRELLDGEQRHEDPARRAEALDALAALWQGDPDRFNGHLDEPDPRGSPYTAALLTLGDLATAERMLAREDAGPERLALADQAVLAARRGEFTRALELTERCLVPGTRCGPDTSRVSMFQTAALILLALGQVRRASDLVDEGHGGRTALVHLLAVPQARVAMSLGDHEQADHILNRAFEDASDSDTVVGTDELWFVAAQLAMATGQRGRLALCLGRAEAVANRLVTGRALALSLLVRASVEPRSGAAALDAVRELGQPFDLATAIEHLVRVGAADPQLLREAYDLLGAVGALLARARMRALMREHDVAVPDRQAVVAENERLLAVLVAQDFGNEQISALLGVSRRSIESRLTRLFTRYGYQSRLELAMAARHGGATFPSTGGTN